MGDAVAVALLVKRGFRQEDFASFHPAGSLGKKLFVRVKDLMHKGESPAVDRIVYAGNGSIDGDII